MNPAEFVATVGGAADEAAAETGLNRWAILTQWALETGWGAANSTYGWNNLAGIIYHGIYENANGFTKYPSLEAFVQDYVGVLRQANMAVILRSAGQPIAAQLVAFGESPWAGSHYNNGGGPGSSLEALWNSVLAPLAVVPPSPPVPVVPSPPSPSSGGLSVEQFDYLVSQLQKLAAHDGVTLDPFVPAPPAPAPAPPPAPVQLRLYTVVEGDSLSLIAQRELGDGNRWPEIYKLNESVVGPNPDLIHPGQVLHIPLS